MTTIAYHHESKTIAWESRRTGSNGEIKSNSSEKHREVNGVHFWICGACCDEQLMVSAYFEGSVKLVPECYCFAYDSGALYRCGVTGDGNLWKESVDFNDAIGSGGTFAISSMDYENCAIKAVEYAITKDCYSGGEVKSMKL